MLSLLLNFLLFFHLFLYNNVIQSFQIQPHQKLFISYIFYKKFIPVFDKNLNDNFENKNPYAIFAFTAIANAHGLD